METQSGLVVLVDLNVTRGSLRRSNPQERPYVAAVGASAFFSCALPHDDGGGVRSLGGIALLRCVRLNNL